MAKNTFFGNLFGGIGDALTGGGALKGVGSTLDNANTGVVQIGTGIKNSQDTAEYNAVLKNSGNRGRAANMLSGPTGSLVSSNQLNSASKQLLGS